MEPDDFTLGEITDRRIATRYVISVPITLRLRDRRVAGKLVDVSNSGAKIECLPVGARSLDTVAIELVWFEDERPSLLARFIRETSSGCGVQFTDAEPFLRLFVKLARMHDDRALDCFHVLPSTRF